MATQFMAAVPRRLLGEQVLDVRQEADSIVGALDCLFQGV
jgi:hypothetical protein